MRPDDFGEVVQLLALLRGKKLVVGEAPEVVFKYMITGEELDALLDRNDYFVFVGLENDKIVVTGDLHVLPSIQPNAPTRMNVVVLSGDENRCNEQYIGMVDFLLGQAAERGYQSADIVCLEGFPHIEELLADRCGLKKMGSVSLFAKRLD